AGFSLGEVLGELTIAELAAQAYDRLDQRSTNLHLGSAPRSTGAQAWPASRGQEALWYLWKLSPESTAYNIKLAARLRSPIDAEALRQACQCVIRRHSALRATFEVNERGDLVQTIDAAATARFDFTTIDASGWGETALRARLNQEAGRG